MVKDWNLLPEFMRCDEVRVYYDILTRKRVQLFIKRIFDVVASGVLIIFLAIPMVIVSAMIKADSRGGVFFRQERVTSYGKHFYIHKFRTMVDNAEMIGTAVTVNSDSRITRVGELLRKKRIDELPQLFDILVGNMTFVGTRAEVPKYVKEYTKEMYATLLLPAGLTSEASIAFKDEADMMLDVDNADKVYIESILPAKMNMNLDSLRRFSLKNDFKTLLHTITSV